MDSLKTAHAHALQKTMLEAQDALQEAHKQYQSAFDLAMDTRGNPDTAVAFRREGRAYAQALSAYTNATMAWLSFVDRRLHPGARGKTPSSD